MAWQGSASLPAELNLIPGCPGRQGPAAGPRLRPQRVLLMEAVPSYS